MNLYDKFSIRQAIEPEEAEIVIRDDAPAELRSAFVQIAYEAGLSPTQVRQVVCRVLRTEPDSWNWTDFPNVDEEVRRRVGECKWYEVYDLIEAIDQALRVPEKHGLKGSFRLDAFERELNNYFRKTGIGWYLGDGRVQARGPETFNRPVAEAIIRLGDTGFNIAKTELHEALQDMSRRPTPDLTGALQHAIVALECVAREVCGDQKPTLGQLLSRHRGVIPAPLDQAVEKAWGFASEQARHLREGQELDYAEVEFVVGLAATVSGYLATKHRG